MRAKDVMSPGVISVEPSASIRDAAAVMLSRHISGLPVIEASGRLAGILSEGDLLRRVELGTERKRPRWLAILLGPGKGAEDYVRSHARNVADVMTQDVVSVTEETELTEVVQLMNDRRIKRVPVLRGEAVVGMISRADLLKALEDILERGSVAADQSDTAIRDAILKEIESQSWAPTGTVSIKVQGGVVELSGCIFEDREREALKVAAGNVPGVTSIKDRLTTVEPYSGMIVSTGEDDQG